MSRLKKTWIVRALFLNLRNRFNYKLFFMGVIISILLAAAIVCLMKYRTRPFGIATGGELDLSIEENLLEEDGAIEVSNLVPNDFSYIGDFTITNNMEYSIDLYLKYSGNNSFITSQDNTSLEIGRDIFLVFSPDKDDPFSEGHFDFSDLESPYELGPISNLLPGESVSIYVNMCITRKIYDRTLPNFEFVLEFALAPSYETSKFDVDLIEFEGNLARINMSLNMKRRSGRFPATIYPIILDFPDRPSIEFKCEGNECEYDGVIPTEGRRWLYPFDVYSSKGNFKYETGYASPKRDYFGVFAISYFVRDNEFHLHALRIAGIVFFLVLLFFFCYFFHMVLSDKQKHKRNESFILAIISFNIGLLIYEAPVIPNLGIIIWLISTLAIYFCSGKRKKIQHLPGCKVFLRHRKP